MMEIKIGERATIQISRQDQWVVLLVDDGVSKATLSIDPIKAIDVAYLIRGAAVTAAHTPSRIKPDDTRSRIADVECPSCRARRDDCRLCGGTGVVTEQQAADWPEVT
jgi:hypothetical protein